MFDNACKFLAENFSEDYATWLLGRPVQLTKLSPTELSLEPIRADSLILEQSEDLVLHLEFQTEPDKTMGFRMLDYRVRVYRRFPNKTMHQVVIYLKPTKSALVYQDSFQLGETIHRYRVVRLWEQSSEVFLKKGGLFPLAVLTESENRIIRLREVAQRLDTIEDPGMRANLMAATALFAGLVMEPETIKTILRNDIMKESAFYQDILQEGLEQGKLEAKLEMVAVLRRLGLTLEQIAQELGLDLVLVQQFVAGQSN
ncbi:MAG: Rpn family recombination-promoting nuclease/putative transposase [Snowella sp.]